MLASGASTGQTPAVAGSLHRRHSCRRLFSAPASPVLLQNYDSLEQSRGVMPFSLA